MNRFRIECDRKARQFCSSQIITKETNSAAKSLGIFSENDDLVMYDCLGQKHGANPKAFWCAFELPFPNLILNQTFPKPIFGLSKDNAALARYAGYPTELLNYATLGVNRKNWPMQSKNKKEKFVFMAMDESSSRSGMDILVPAFGEQFKGNHNVVLYIKDREATAIFKSWVKEQSEKYDVLIIHDDRHLESYEEQAELFNKADAAICVNRSHSFGMTVLQAMSCGVPMICHQYNGLADYTSSSNVSNVSFKKTLLTQEALSKLDKIGLKNHLFPPQHYSVPPFWSEVDKDDLKIKMQQMIEDNNLRENLKNMGDLTASWFSWERTAMNMSYILSLYK